MTDELFSIFDLILFVGVVLCIMFFSSMWHILYGKWYAITPAWKWPHDIRELKKMSSTAETDTMRNECRSVLNGICFSIVILIVGILSFFIS